MGRLLVILEYDFEHRAALDQLVDGLDLRAVPGCFRRAHDGAALVRVGDDACGCGQISFHIALEVEREFWIGFQVGEPVSGAWRAGNDGLIAYLVEPDFGAREVSRAAACCGDVDDHLFTVNRLHYLFVHA